MDRPAKDEAFETGSGRRIIAPGKFGGRDLHPGDIVANANGGDVNRMRRLDHLNRHYTGEWWESLLILRGFLAMRPRAYIGRLPSRGSFHRPNSRGDFP